MTGRPRASGGHPRCAHLDVSPGKSSPRERGSSSRKGGTSDRSRVVPARAGVIRRSRRAGPWSCCRPRASGGHPTLRLLLVGEDRSSPRERGSSLGVVRGPLAGVVVPARAGVILAATSAPCGPKGRPRASGGHPPRERGSSGRHPGADPRLLVVPARAGVIPAHRATMEGEVGRPRASGGHPAGHVVHVHITASSPRERGSSALARGRTVELFVVPARAGVIPGTRLGGDQRARRPRASGGHPPTTWDRRRYGSSSPRERGSSHGPRVGVDECGVVPARAGVIPPVMCFPE